MHVISPRIYFTSLLAVHIDSAAIVADIAVIIALELFTLLLVFVLYFGESHSNLANHIQTWRIGELHAFKTNMHMFSCRFRYHYSSIAKYNFRPLRILW